MTNIKKLLKIIDKGCYAVDIKSSERDAYDTAIYEKIEEYDSMDKVKRVQIKDSLEIKIKKKENEIKKLLLELTLLKIEKVVCNYAIRRGKNERFIRKQTEYLKRTNKLNVLRKLQEDSWIIENALYKAIIEVSNDTATIHLMANPIKEYIYSINVTANSIEEIFNEHLYKYFNDTVNAYDISELFPIADENVLGELKVNFLSNRVK